VDWTSTNWKRKEESKFLGLLSFFFYYFSVPIAPFYNYVFHLLHWPFLHTEYLVHCSHSHHIIPVLGLSRLFVIITTVHFPPLLFYIVRSNIYTESTKKNTGISGTWGLGTKRKMRVRNIILQHPVALCRSDLCSISCQLCATSFNIHSSSSLYWLVFHFLPAVCNFS
jgi:hypothetical protein